MPYIEIIEWRGDALAELATYFGKPYEPAVGTVFELTGSDVRVGRADENDLVLPVGNVSRLHFRLVAEARRYVYEDVASRRIPMYNGKPFSGGKRIVEDGDTFNAAGILFRYRDSEPS